MSYDRAASAGYLTNLAGRLFVRALERRLSSGSAGPMPVFLALDDGQSLTQRDLARQAAVEQPTMAATLGRMERDGLILRTPDPNDGRSALISLTEQGRERARAAFAAAASVNDVGLSRLKPQERPVFLDMLRRVASALEADGSA